MNLELIRVFEAMLMDMNVSKAAERLGLSQSGMSHALARLRQELDDVLFVKIAGGMAPTPRAMSLAGLVNTTMESARAISASPEELEPSTLVRTFSFVMTDLGETVFLPKILGFLQRMAPGCSVRCLQLPPNEVLHALEQGKADLAIGHLRWKPDELRQQALFRESLVCVARRGHPIAKPGWTKKDYWNCSHVVVSLSGELADAYNLIPEKVGTKRRIVATTPHWLALPHLLVGSDLIATVPEPLAKQMADDGFLVLPPPFPLAPFDLRLYWHPRFHNDAALRWLRSSIYKLCARG